MMDGQLGGIEQQSKAVISTVEFCMGRANVYIRTKIRKLILKLNPTSTVALTVTLTILNLSVYYYNSTNITCFCDI